MLMQKTRIRTYKQMTKREILADSLLLLTALIWGCAFAVVKNALDSFPPGAIIAMRYLIAAAITGILFRRHLKELTRGDVARGALVGLLLFGAYIVQTTGLQYTTAGKNAFLTTVYVLLVPFGCALLFHQKLQKSNLIAAVMMLVGIGLLSLDGQGGGLNPGDILTLICGFLFAGHIIAVEQCQKKTNTYALIVLQFAFCALYAGLYNRIFERGHAAGVHAGFNRRSAVYRGFLHHHRHEPAKHRPEHGPRFARSHSAFAGIGVRRAVFLPAAGRKGHAANGRRLCDHLCRAAGQRTCTGEKRLTREYVVGS